MATETGKAESSLEMWVGIWVVLLATFLGVCSVKAGNIGQKMDRKQVERNNMWMWYQARNIRETVYEATSAEISVSHPGESTEAKTAREKLSADYHGKALDQEKKKEEQKTKAETADEEYEELGRLDDQFDLCAAGLALALALMGVTVLLKQWWMFVVALIPAAIGVFMGVAGFLGMDTGHPAISWLIEFLS